MNKLTILAILTSIFLFTPSAFSCTNSTGAWVNCTVIQNQTNPLGGVFSTVNANFPALWGFMYVLIMIFAFGLFRLYNPSILSAAYASFLGMIVSAVMIAYALLSPSFMDISVGLFALSIVILYLFR